jgi:superfamily II DNA or RNA helicase
VTASAPQRGDLVRIRDERWTVSDTVVHRDSTVLTVVGCDHSNRGSRTRYLLPFEPVDRLPSVSTTQVTSHPRWRHLAREVLARTSPSIDSLRAAATADISILPYQLEPALALVSGLAARILIADEVGLGKTVQAGLLVAETLARRADAHVLVLCPAGLRQQWRDELIGRFHLAPVVLDAAALRRVPHLEGANPWAVHPLILTSTDYIKRPEVVRALEPLVWDLLVIDEAHGIAGQSDRHEAATLLTQRARAVVMLTATPHAGDEIAFERLTSVGDLEKAFPLLVFRRTRADTSDRTGRRTRWVRIRPTDAEAEMHRALTAYVRHVWHQPASPAARLAMIILTRRACSSASSLLRTLERRLALLGVGATNDVQLQLPLWLSANDDDEPGAEVGAPGLENADSERRALEALIALAYRASVPEGSGAESKFRSLVRFLRRSKQPAIVFTEYRDTLTSLQRVLRSFETCQLHGGLTTVERADAIREFTTGDRSVLLATDAASEGLNLHHRCRLVVHLEVPWTPTRIEQRVGRVDRIGQSRTVHQVLLVSGGTVEESRVTRVIQRMSNVASAWSALSRHTVDELQCAAHVIGNEPAPDAPRAEAVPAGVITADLRQRAADEAIRLAAARQLRPTCDRGQALPHLRPFVTTARRASRGSAWWALWLEFADSEGQLVWETLIGVHGIHLWPRPRFRSDVRSRLDASWTQIQNSVAVDRGRLADLLSGSIRAPAALAMDRERAIARDIDRRHARMAATLIQGALFDRRTERDATSQRELIDEAMSRCHQRIAELHRLRDVTTAVRPAFSLIAW